MIQPEKKALLFMANPQQRSCATGVRKESIFTHTHIDI